MSNGTVICTDMAIEQALDKNWDLVVVPGGQDSAKHMLSSTSLIEILEKQKISGKLYASIGESPALVLAPKGLVSDGATCHPAYQDTLRGWVNEKVVVQNNVVTSQGIGTALDFSLKLGELLYGAERAREIEESFLIPHRVMKKRKRTKPLKPQRKEMSEQELRNIKQDWVDSGSKIYSWTEIPNGAGKRNIFKSIIWPALLSVGWTSCRGSRPTDTYYIPSGVVRGDKGGKLRVDYFDSVTQVLKHMSTPKWAQKKEIVACQEEVSFWIYVCRKKGIFFSPEYVTNKQDC